MKDQSALLPTRDVKNRSSYQSQSDPGLCQVHQDAVLCPPPSGSDLFQCQVVAVLLQMNLYDQSNCINCDIVPTLASV